jgi:hypothetical protein
MKRTRSGWLVPAVLGACVAGAFAGPGSAQAFVLSNTPDALPLLGFAYTIPGGVCFSTAGYCVAGADFTLTSLAPPGLVQTSNEDITTNATATIDLANSSHVPIGTVTLTGTVEQDVLRRPNEFDTGSWTVDLESLSLSGTLNSLPITVMLNPADLGMDTGTTSIVEDGAVFRVDSFFDVFAEISYDGLTATASGAATAGGVPEPATLALLAGPLLVLSAARRRHK